MKFNKLYNLILESIISQNKASRKAMLQKKGWNQFGIEAIFDYLDNFDNKTADFLCRYIADGTIKGGADERADVIDRGGKQHGNDRKEQDPRHRSGSLHDL